ncbi:unnamed protein product [Microthlaspi erraticum]|uniref:F-box associated beta-propeller type 1 domain-containing protein n=1 Tax=Microthlaspi erraticum TaxID=1685480 RepID=A0A6D2HR80_9BRAS|nr:unnamed protein product [Microthlaspi erraticum]
MFKDPRVCNVNLSQNVVAQFMGALDLKVSHSNSEQVDIAQVFHCDGLLLCTTKDKKLVVWNPCLGETRWIQPKPNYQYYTDSTFSLGYQNNKSFRIYKILRCWDRYEYNRKGRFEIYEFSSNSWRCVDETALDFFCIWLRGVSLKGNTFWIAMERKEENSYVLSFDFTTERFKRWSLPAFQNAGYVMDLSVVREENLLVLYQCYNSKEIEIWVTKKFDDNQAALSWSKYFTVDLLKINRSRNLCPTIASVVIYEEKNMVLCCSDGLRRMSMDVYITGEDDVYCKEIYYDQEIKSRNKVLWPFIFNYAPSLVHI